MSVAVNALALLDAQLKDRAERAARYGRHADKAAAKHGARQVTADRMADHAKVLLAELLAVRAAVAELIAADSQYDSARAAWLADHSKHDKFLAAHTAWDRRAAALARVKGEAA
ncbi:TPA: hypothetical protein ACJ509_000260 [Stenotrophomonas maltophilia]